MPEHSIYSYLICYIYGCYKLLRKKSDKHDKWNDRWELKAFTRNLSWKIINLLHTTIEQFWNFQIFRQESALKTQQQKTTSSCHFMYPIAIIVIWPDPVWISWVHLGMKVQKPMRLIERRADEFFTDALGKLLLIICRKWLECRQFYGCF